MDCTGNQRARHFDRHTFEVFEPASIPLDPPTMTRFGTNKKPIKVLFQHARSGFWIGSHIFLYRAAEGAANWLGFVDIRHRRLTAAGLDPAALLMTSRSLTAGLWGHLSPADPACHFLPAQAQNYERT
jgi:hypothetical protein